MAPRNSWVSVCPTCGYLLSTLRPGSGTGVEGLEALRRLNDEVVLNCLQRHRRLEGSRLLEVGCAKGWFLEAAARREMKVAGVEPEAANATIARSRGFDVESGFFPEGFGRQGPYDVIAFNDVFEHIPDPVSAIRAVERLLAPRGVAILNLPSSGGALFAVADAFERVGWTGPYDRLWQKGLPSPHISYFDPDNIVGFVRRHTSLLPLDATRLRSISRNGLRARILSTIPGFAGNTLFVGSWLASFVIDALPADIMLVLFEKSAPVMPSKPRNNYTADDEE